MDPFDRLLGRAQSKVPGLEANATLWNVRREIEAEHSAAILYEMVLSSESTWESFLRIQLARLTEHFSAKGLPMLGGPNVRLSVWRGPEMFLFSCEEFFGAICEIESLDSRQLKERIGDWRVSIGLERRGAGTWQRPEVPKPMLGLPAKASPSHGAPIIKTATADKEPNEEN
jgi:hypothetical protein